MFYFINKIKRQYEPVKKILFLIFYLINKIERQ